MNPIDLPASKNTFSTYKPPLVEDIPRRLPKINNTSSSSQNNEFFPLQENEKPSIPDPLKLENQEIQTQFEKIDSTLNITEATHTLFVPVPLDNLVSNSAIIPPPPPLDGFKYTSPDTSLLKNLKKTKKDSSIPEQPIIDDFNNQLFTVVGNRRKKLEDLESSENEKMSSEEETSEHLKIHPKAQKIDSKLNVTHYTSSVNPRAPLNIQPSIPGRIPPPMVSLILQDHSKNDSLNNKLPKKVSSITKNSIEKPSSNFHEELKNFDHSTLKKIQPNENTYMSTDKLLLNEYENKLKEKKLNGLLKCQEEKNEEDDEWED